jgi:hypothetical protein
VRRLKAFVATSVDGYVTARDGDVSWRFRDAEPLGAGIPFVAAGATRTTVALIAERRYPSGVVQLTYRVERD